MEKGEFNQGGNKYKRMAEGKITNNKGICKSHK